jgi:hypothetical protein
MENLEEMDIFLDKYDLSKLNLEDIENLNGSTMNSEIAAVIVSQQRNPQNGPERFTAEFYQTLT